MIFPRFTFFQFLTIAIFFTFMGVMTIVTFTAYSRKSGSTGLSMAKIQQMRFEVTANPQNSPGEQREKEHSL